jgi:outer membrane protein assembly factor BamB
VYGGEVRGFAVITTVLCIVSSASAATLTGTVYLDVDGDSAFSAPDEPLAGVRVAFGPATYVATTDAAGEYTVTVPDGVSGIVWASVPEIGRPGPAWSSVTSATGTIEADIAIVPAADVGDTFSFVVFADSHMDGDDAIWTADDLGLALDQGLATPVPPRFFTIVGDITQANRPEDFAQVDAAFAAVDAPWVPVPGNHDWYDGGAAYRAKWGPDSYSFTTGGVHVVVWNSALSAAAVRTLITRDLEGIDPATTVIALGHVPPRDDVAAAMRDAGVDAIFTGHWHANRVIDHDGLVEYGTQTAVMGGIDLSPAGYRVVDVAGGSLAIAHHNFVDEPVVELVAPSSPACVTDGGELLVSVEVGSATTRVTATIDGGDAIVLERAGGWVWRGSYPALDEGAHDVTIPVEDVEGELVRRTASLYGCVADEALVDLAPMQTGEWRGLQGGPEHLGSVADPLPLPLAPLWTAALGGHAHLGAPVVEGGRVFVAISDFADGADDGVVALDLTTGATLWRYLADAPVHHAPAVADGTVVLATTTGRIIALAAEDGTERWTLDLAEGFDSTETALWASPTIADGTVYVGHQHRLVAVDVAAGTILWSATPEAAGDTSGSASALAVGVDDVVGAFHRNSGVASWTRDGEPRWRQEGPPVQGVNGAVLAVGDRLFVGNVAGAVTALDRRTGEILWTTPLIDAHTWAYASAGSFAYADGRLFVPLVWGRFVALDAETGAELWSKSARAGTLRTAHYRGDQPGFQASPLVAGDQVWAADTSGLLHAWDAATGDERWSYDLRVPVLGGMAAAGELLVVATWDGTVRVFADVDRVPTHAEPPAGCCSAGRPTADVVLGILLVAMALRRRRRHDRRVARSR